MPSPPSPLPPRDLARGRQSALGLPAHDKSVKLLENGAKVDVRIHRDPAGFTVAPPAARFSMMLMFGSGAAAASRQCA